jgi:hypothetical protein
MQAVKIFQVIDIHGCWVWCVECSDTGQECSYDF